MSQRVSSGNGPLFTRHQVCRFRCMVQTSASMSTRASSFSGEPIVPRERSFIYATGQSPSGFLEGIRRRWQRRLQRRKVGRAYDMAREIARVLPANARVLDVGCGSGFIAHHLSAMTGTKVVGIDLGANIEAAIDYRQFDGQHFPVADESVDAVLLCYVLHHAQRLEVVLHELRRVLSAGGRAVVYEDIPSACWDRILCWTHNLKWRRRTGPCTFHSRSEWSAMFKSAGFEVITERPLSRWRNFTHPVRRNFFLIKLAAAMAAQS
jgi:SAM-dependent methyltransferase